MIIGVMRDDLEGNRANGCIHSVENAFNKAVGLAVLTSNIAANVYVVKMSGIDESIWIFVAHPA